jgi:hypothetical protein
VTSPRSRSERRGFAFPAAIIALVLLSALVAGALFVSTEELRSGRGDASDQRALAAAEWALDRAMLSWDPRRNTAQGVGSTAVLLAELGAPNDSVVVTATRVQRNGFWLTSAATRGGDWRGIPARHTVGASLRLVSVVVPARAALTTAGAVSVENGLIDGRNAATAADATSVCANAQGAAGVAVPDASRVTCTTCAASAGAGVFGTPPIDSTAVVDSSLWFGDSGVAELVRRAAIELPGGTATPRPTVVNGDCDRADALNWGDPDTASSPCADWLPVIHVMGSIVLGAASVGQGILVADGSVRLEGNARFLGIVIARGSVEVGGLGAEIVGAAFAGAASTATVSRVTDGGAIRFASCAMRRAVTGAARLARTPDRWWIELR